jgi:beta-glucanase (GH16 family)
MAARSTSWHIAVIEWSASACSFSLDGKAIGTSTSRIPDTPMHWVLQTETALSGGAPSDSAAGDVQVDWVVAYAPSM